MARLVAFLRGVLCVSKRLFRATLRLPLFFQRERDFYDFFVVCLLDFRREIFRLRREETRRTDEERETKRKKKKKKM